MDQRFLLNTERTHLFTPNINIVMKIDIGGIPGMIDLQQAIDSAVVANEALNCKIVLEKGVAGYERLEKPIYSIGVSSRDWKEIVREQESIIFRLAEGELIRFYILTEESNIKLLVIAHHLAGDGLSIVYLIEDIMKALSGHSLEFKPLQIANSNNWPKKSEIKIITKLLLKRLNQKWMKKGDVFTFADYESMFTNYWDSRKTYICCETFSQEELEILSDKSRQAKVSLNSLITTAFILASEKLANTGLAVSTREKGFRGMANHTTGITLEYQYNESKSFLQNAQEVHQDIYQRLGQDKKRYFVPRFLSLMEGTLIDSACMTAYGNYNNEIAEYFTELMGYGCKLKDVAITNLTKLDIAKEYEQYDISNFTFVAPIVPYTHRVIGIATLGGEMCITMHTMEDENVEREIMFFEKAMGVLKTMR